MFLKGLRRTGIICLASVLLGFIAKAGFGAEEKDLVLYYKFDIGFGASALDHSGNSQHATIHGAKWVDGKFGKALEFDGENDYVTTGLFSMHDTDYTKEMWIKPRTNLSSGLFYLIGPQCYNRQALKIRDGRLRLYHRSGADHIMLSSSPYDFKIDRWHHVAGTFSETNGMSLYINGDPVAIDNSKVKSSNWPLALIGASGGTGVGGRLADFNGFFKGVIDEVRIYHRELSAEEIKQRYQDAVN